MFPPGTRSPASGTRRCPGDLGKSKSAPAAFLSPSAPAGEPMTATSIRLLVLDVDGVLTDGGITVNADGTQSVTFYVRDGAGIKYLQNNGVSVAILSGRSIPAVAARCR